MDGSAPGNVVLVHGGFVDGSGWQGVYSILKKDGYNVRAEPMRSMLRTRQASLVHDLDRGRSRGGRHPPHDTPPGEGTDPHAGR